MTDIAADAARRERERLAALNNDAVERAMAEIERLAASINHTVEGAEGIPHIVIAYGRLRTVIQGALVGKTAQEEIDAEFANKYPEHAKLKPIQPLTQAVGDFMEWLAEQKLPICEMTRDEAWSQYLPTMRSRDRLLAEHFGINQKRLDKEKDAMLEEHRRRFGIK